MNLILKDRVYLPEGIFGKLQSPAGVKLFETLERSYPQENVPPGGYNFLPKLRAGTYVCERGMHHLHSGPLETFEITGVPGHTGVLFHPLNLQSGSEGCVGVGRALYVDAITNSRDAFEEFLKLQTGLSHFTLTVEP